MARGIARGSISAEPNRNRATLRPPLGFACVLPGRVSRRLPLIANSNAGRKILAFVFRGGCDRDAGRGERERKLRPNRRAEKRRRDVGIPDRQAGHSEPEHTIQEGRDSRSEPATGRLLVHARGYALLHDAGRSVAAFCILPPPSHPDAFLNLARGPAASNPCSARRDLLRRMRIHLAERSNRRSSAIRERTSTERVEREPPPSPVELTRDPRSRGLRDVGPGWPWEISVVLRRGARSSSATSTNKMRTCKTQSRPLVFMRRDVRLCISFSLSLSLFHVPARRRTRDSDNTDGALRNRAFRREFVPSPACPWKISDDFCVAREIISRPKQPANYQFAITRDLDVLIQSDVRRIVSRVSLITFKCPLPFNSIY